MNVYILVDPSKGSGERSDRSAIPVIGIDQGGNKYLLDGVCHRMKLSERWEWIKKFKKQWERHPGVQMVKVGYERYGMQTDLETITDMMERENNFFEIHELNTPRQGGHSKKDRIERLEPDIRDGRFYLPCIAYHPNLGDAAEGFMCFWSVWTEQHAKNAEAKGVKHDYNVGQVLYRPAKGLTRRQQPLSQGPPQAQARIVRAVRRKNEDGEIYDLTRLFIEEMVRHPFAAHDDLLDACSRIYDIESEIPVLYERRSTETDLLDKDELMDPENVVTDYGDNAGSMGAPFRL
jgi:hypothetical protein